MQHLPSVRFGIVIAAFAALMTSAEARTFKAAAVNGAATITDGQAQVSFKIEFTNDEELAMTGVTVVFEDGSEVSLGDVEAGATVTSDEQSRTVNMGDTGSRSVVMKVTLKYAQDGAATETPWVFSVVAE
jgi:hypothetical protein